MKRTETATMSIRNAEWWKSLAVAAAIGVIWILPAICISRTAPGLPFGAVLSASAALGVLAAALVAVRGGAPDMAPLGAIVSGARGGQA